jgi:hypothetical protein
VQVIQDSIVFEGIYFDAAGFELSPAELNERVARDGSVEVFGEDGARIGDMIQLRRVDGCLEALIETTKGI